MRRRSRQCLCVVLLSLVTGCSAGLADERSTAARTPSASSAAVPAGPPPALPPSAVPPPAVPSSVSRPAGLPGAPLRVVVVGDSVTAADSGSVAEGRFGPGSWAYTADQDGVDVIGGWAVKGATTEAMAGGVGPANADTLVIMGGTNDVLQGLPWARSAAAIRQIVRTAGVPDVVLCSIVPSAVDPAGVAAYNQQLAGLAAAEGWQLVDPDVAVRTADGSWAAGMSEDGTHPTATAAALIGAAVHDALLQ